MKRSLFILGGIVGAPIAFTFFSWVMGNIIGFLVEHPVWFLTVPVGLLSWLGYYLAKEFYDARWS